MTRRFVQAEVMFIFIDEDRKQLILFQLQLLNTLLIYNSCNHQMHSKKIKLLRNPEQDRCKQTSANESKKLIGTYEQAHELHKENQYIRRGYRINYNDLKSVFKSLFEAHNETVNIWTHIIGATIIFYLIFEGCISQVESNSLGKALIEDFVSSYSMKPRDMLLQPNSTLFNFYRHNGSVGEQMLRKSVAIPHQIEKNQLATWPITIFLLSSGISLTCSVLYHLIHPLNEKTFKISLGLDYAGVGINMAIAPIPLFYYSMYCNQTVRNLYIFLNAAGGLVNFASSIIVLAFNIKENKTFKLWKLMFSSWMCIFGLMHIVIDQIFYNNHGDSYSIIPCFYLIFGALICYMFGFIFYASRCPERSHPGRYDVCGHSHQIWHTFAVLGIILSYLAILICYEIRKQSLFCPLNDDILFKN